MRIRSISLRCPRRQRRCYRGCAVAVLGLVLGASAAAQDGPINVADVAPPDLALTGDAQRSTVLPAAPLNVEQGQASAASKAAPLPVETPPPYRGPWQNLFEDALPAGKERDSLLSRLGIGIELETEVVHDDNIFYSGSGDEVSDVIFRLRPGFFFELGEELADEGSYARLGYRPTASIFAENDGENSFDHDASIVFATRGGRLSTEFDAGYQTLSEASVDAGQRADREVVRADLVMEYAIGGRTGVRTEFGYERADYDVLSDFNEWNANIYATYQLGGKTTVGLGYGYGELRPDSGTDQQYQRALARAEWQATAKMALAAWGGYDFRSGGTADGNTGVFGMELDAQLREGTRVSLRAYRDIGASALLGAETYTLTGFSAEFEQRLGRRFAGAIGVGYEDYAYSGGGELGSARSDHSVFVRPALRYQLHEELSAELFYLFREGDSSIDLLDFENNQVGASLRYRF